MTSKPAEDPVRVDPEPTLPPPPDPPGGEAALPTGSLPKPFLGPQGDENRDPPANAPAPVNPTETVKSEDPASPPGEPDRG